MRIESGRSVRGLAILSMVAFILTAGSIYLGSAGLSRQIAALSFVCLSCYIIYEYVVLRLLYLRIHLGRTRLASDSPDLRKQVWDGIAIFERRAGMVLFVLGLMFVGSIFKGLGIGISLLLALAIVLYARKLRII
jgi:hypothetical protein